jgi:hypothetical protein
LESLLHHFDADIQAALRLDFASSTDQRSKDETIIYPFEPFPDFRPSSNRSISIGDADRGLDLLFKEIRPIYPKGMPPTPPYTPQKKIFAYMCYFNVMDRMQYIDRNPFRTFLYLRRYFGSILLAANSNNSNNGSNSLGGSAVNKICSPLESLPSFLVSLTGYKKILELIGSLPSNAESEWPINFKMDVKDEMSVDPMRPQWLQSVRSKGDVIDIVVPSNKSTNKRMVCILDYNMYF